jgi:predicted glycosyltransferase
MRRNLLLAQTFAQTLGADILMITGAREATALPIPPGVDTLTLPALFKQDDGRYRPRRFSFGVHELIALRAQIIRAALEMFQPDVFIVDNVPRGAMRELDPALHYLRLDTPAHAILGLRDVLDTPETVRRQWRAQANFEAVRELYDTVWVYGDPAVYDLAEAYDFPPELRARMRFTGYLDAAARDEANAPPPNDLPLALHDEPFNLCVVGGGQDGAHLATLFAHATQAHDTPGLIVTGPYMPAAARERLHRLAEITPHLHVTRFVAAPTALFRRAERVVSMGGYNTVCELLSIGKPTLILPRLHPRKEQFIRAERLSHMGLLDVMLPTKATPDRLLRWLRQPLVPRTPPRARIDMCGLERLPALLTEALPSHFPPVPHPQPRLRHVAC